MRILYWLLGAAATAAGAAYVASRGKRRSIAKDFLQALQQGPVKILVDEPHIVASGIKAETFRGEACGRAFAFVAKTDASGTRWTFVLAWSGAGQFVESWSPLRDASEHPLREAYALLRRHASKMNGSPLN